MTRELWLLRHAEAKKDRVMNDFDRPLKHHGRRDALKIGGWMREHNWYPQYLVCSPANRAVSTAVIVCQQLGMDGSAINQDERLYFQGPEQIKTILANIPKHLQSALLVGHNPDFEGLLIGLLGSAIAAVSGDVFPTATLVRLAMPDAWNDLKVGCASLLDITYP
jgi:phosphohistidine phosphatase